MPSVPSHDHLSKHLEARQGRRALNTSRVIDEGEALSTSKVGEKEGAQLSIRAGGRRSVHKTY